jgi:uncharacterized protein involved in outer membrane biogenesis
MRALAAVGPGIVVALVAGSWIVIASIDWNPYRGRIEDAARELTGRDARIEGDLRPSFSLEPAIAAHGVTLANTAWGSDPEMVRVGRLEIAIRLIPLLRGEVDVRRFVLHDVRALIETDGEGRGNWEFDLGEAEEVEDAGDAKVVFVRQVLVEGAEIRYRDGETGETGTLEVESLSFRPRDAARGILELESHYEGEPIRISGESSRVRTLLENQPFSFDLMLEAFGVKARLEGSVAEPIDARGLDLKLTAETTSLETLSPLTGVELPAVEPASFDGRIVETDGVFRIDGLELTAGESVVSGELVFDPRGERPSLSGRLSSPSIDLSALAGDDASSEAAPDPDGRVFSADPLPLDLLRIVDADVAVEVARIRGGGVEIEDVKLRARLENGRLRVDPLSTRVAGGELSGAIDFDARAGRPELAIEAKGREIGFGRLISDIGGRDLGQGARTDADVDLRASGDSVRALMASLDGRVDVVIGEGRLWSGWFELVGADILGQIADLAYVRGRPKEYTALRCAVLGLGFREGVVKSNREVALESDKLKVVVNGTVDLRDERIALAIRPDARVGVGLGAGDLAKLVYLAGTLAEPKTTLDLEGVLKQSAAMGLAVATFGLSYVAREIVEDRNPCRTAMDLAAAARAGDAEAKPLTPREAVKSVRDGLRMLLDP